MNILMNVSGIRFFFTLLSFANFYLISRLFDTFAIVSSGRLSADECSLSIAILVLSILAIYYLIKIIWRDKYLNFKHGTGTHKIFATIIMFITGFSAIHLLEYSHLIGFSFNKTDAVLVAVTGLYMLVVAIISAVFVSGVAYTKELDGKITGE